MAESILQDTSATISATFTVDGEVPSPVPTAATIQITRADGTVLVATTAATDEGDATFSYVLTQSHTAELDTLIARWTATIDSQPSSITTRIEIVGGFYFTVAEFRARYPGAEVTALTADQIADARATAEDIIEHEAHVAFVPRATTLTVSGQRSTKLALPIYLLRSIESATIDGEVQDVTDYRVAGGAVYRWTDWPRNPSNTVLTVTHGYDAPPRRIKDAAMTLAYHRAIKGPIDDRATSIPAGEAGGVITLLTPGVQGSITGIPEVDAAIIAYRLPDPGSVSSVAVVDSANAYPDPLEDFATG